MTCLPSSNRFWNGRWILASTLGAVGWMGVALLIGGRTRDTVEARFAPGPETSTAGSRARRMVDRAENVRQIPPGDPDFETLYKRRNDAESINRHLDTLWLRRAHSVGWRPQLLNLITYAMGMNAMSMHVHRQGLAPPVAA